MLDLVHARLLDAPREAEQARSGRLLGPDLCEGCTPDPEDFEHVGEGFHVIDAGRLAEQAMGHRERGLVPGLRALPFDRVEQRRLLTGNVGARPPTKLDLEAEASAHQVLAEQTMLPSPIECALETRSGERVLAAEVDEAALRAGCEPGDREGFDHREGVILHEHPVLERAGLGFVRVAHEVVGPDGLPSHRFPFDAGREGRAAPAQELRVLHLADDSLGPDLEGEAQGLVSAVCAVVVEARRIYQANSPEKMSPRPDRTRRSGCPLARDRLSMPMGRIVTVVVANGFGPHVAVPGEADGDVAAGRGRVLHQGGGRLIAQTETGARHPCP